MDSNFRKVYSYDNVVQLLTVGDNFCVCRGDNAPMNSTTLRVHRGVDNKLIFRALGPDRVPFNIPPNQVVYGRIIDPDNNALMLERICKVGPAKGIITLELDAADASTLHTGLYSLILIRTEVSIADLSDYRLEKPMFSDFENNISMDLEVTDQAMKQPANSFVITPDKWTTDLSVPNASVPIPSFYSSKIPGNRTLNKSSSVHTFSAYADHCYGTLEIWGSLEEEPDAYAAPTRWFKVYPSSMSNDITFVNYSGTQAWSFQANISWLKFRYIPSQAVLDPGKLLKLTVRV